MQVEPVVFFLFYFKFMYRQVYMLFETSTNFEKLILRLTAGLKLLDKKLGHRSTLVSLRD